MAGKGDVQTTRDGWAVVEQTADTTGFLGFRYDPETGSTEITQLSPFLHVSQPSAQVDEIAFAEHLYDRTEGARKNAAVFDLAATRMRELDDWIEQHRAVDDEIAALRDRRVGGDPARPDGVTADEVRAVQETARVWLDRLAAIEERIDAAIVLPAGLARQQTLGTLNHELTTLTKELNAAVPAFQRLRAEGMATSEAQEALLDRVPPTPQPGSPDLLPNPFDEIGELPNPFDAIDDIGELPTPLDAFSEPPSPSFDTDSDASSPKADLTSAAAQSSSDNILRTYRMVAVLGVCRGVTGLLIVLVGLWCVGRWGLGIVVRCRCRSWTT